MVEELGVDPDRVHTIPHGVFAHLAGAVSGELLRHRPVPTEKHVVLMFGLMRPYKGIDVLLEAWRGSRWADADRRCRVVDRRNA